MNPWEAVFQQAVEFHGRGQLAEAASLFTAILEHNADHFPCLHRLAAIRRHQGRLEESRELLERALTSQPESADARNSLANTLNALGHQEEALMQYRRALDLRPNFPEAHLNLANLLKAMRRYQEAAACYRAAIALRPEYAEAHTNLGVVLERLNRPEEALASFLQALDCDPGAHLAFNNVGMALCALNRHPEALPFLQRAREAEPEALEPVLNEGLVRLAMGDYHRGLRGYETRLRIPGLPVSRDYPQPAWNGCADLTGKTILLHAEQGMGDTILFARFLPAVAKTGARVVLEVHQPLTQLMAMVQGVTQVLAPGNLLPEFDVHASFCSLPLLFGTTPDTIPGRDGYLQAPRESPTVAGLPSGPLVGVCWAGNPNYSLDYRRSVPLGVFKQLFKLDGTRFISLQKELRPGDAEIARAFGNLDLVSNAHAQSMADTAALISKLDLVITVDTAVAHLAGALGKPVWILLSHSAYWVWGRERQDSYWYRSARLFRQQKAGDWDSVVRQVYSQLAGFISLASPLIPEMLSHQNSV